MQAMTVLWGATAVAALACLSVPAKAEYPERPVKWDPLESTCRHASLSIL